MSTNTKHPQFIGEVPFEVGAQFRERAAAAGRATAEHFARTAANHLPQHRCAWCEAAGRLTVYSLDRRTIWHTLPAGAEMPLSHGICPECFQKQMGRPLILADVHPGAPDEPIKFTVIP